MKTSQCKHKQPRETCSICDLEDIGVNILPKKKRKLSRKLLYGLFNRFINISGLVLMYGGALMLALVCGYGAYLALKPREWKVGDEVIFWRWSPERKTFGEKYTIVEIHGNAVKFAGNDQFFDLNKIDISDATPEKKP